MQISQKNNVKERSVLFSIYISIYMSIYFYIYIYIYIEKRTELLACFCKKNEMFLHSFPFFAKECCVLGVLFCSLQKNVAFFAFFPIFRKEQKRTERSFGSHTVSRQKLEKRMDKNGTFFFKNRKERYIPNGKERSAQPCFFQGNLTSYSRMVVGVYILRYLNWNIKTF